MSYWSKFESPRSETPSAHWIKGRQINIFPSPHDTPELFRVYLSNRNRSVIEFKYIDEEPLTSLEVGDGLWFWLGRNSLRLYRIDGPAEFLESDKPGMRAKFVGQITTALQRLKDNPATGAARANYELLRAGILEGRNALFGVQPRL